MKQGLQLNISQHLTLTPQLQQAIRLLQLSSLELQQEVTNALNQNPMLELCEPVESSKDNPEQNISSSPSSSEEPMPKAISLDTGLSSPEASMRHSWEETYPERHREQEFNESIALELQTNEEHTIQEHLLWQLRLSPFTETDYQIALALIDSINDDGFLRCDIEDVTQSLKTQYPDLESDEVLAVMHRIQHFDPIGVGARNLRECLLLQLDEYPKDETSHLNTAFELVENHFDLLAEKDMAKIKRKTKYSDEELKDALKLIKSLNPRPASHISTKHAEYIIPDVVVYKHENHWIVELNGQSTPKLRINEQYTHLIRRADESEDNQFLKNNLQEAKWLIKSIESRNETLLKVARCIFEHQKDFLEHGPEAMRPLVLHDIAAAIEMHESTISRITTQKYVDTPKGIFELKYFFSSHVGTEVGGECSSTAIQALISKLISKENPTKPLSNSKIAHVLSTQGIIVARRTIAKYREAMAIPPSNERKTLV